MNHHIARWHSLTLSPADRAILDQMEEEMDETASKKEEATELEWLKYFAINADFGPAHGDVMVNHLRYFEENTGKRVPRGWREYLDEAEDWEADGAVT